MTVKVVCFDRLLQVLILKKLWMHCMSVSDTVSGRTKGPEAGVRTEGPGGGEDSFGSPMVAQDEHPLWNAQVQYPLMAKKL